MRGERGRREGGGSMKQNDIIGWSPFRLAHVEKAIDASAVETLLVTDELFRYQRFDSRPPAH